MSATSRKNRPGAAGGTLLCHSTSANADVTRRLADVAAGLRQARVVAVGRTPAGDDNGLDAMRAWEGRDDLRGLVSDWPGSPEEVQKVLAVAGRLRVPAYILRQGADEQIRRLVVATAGGVHALHLLSLAEAMSDEWKIPVAALRVEPPPAQSEDAGLRRLESILARSFVLGQMVEIDPVASVVHQIEAHTSPGDLLMIGAPHFGMAAHHYGGSLPEHLARIHRGPLMMCLSNPPPTLRFQDFLWADNISLDTEGLDRDALMAHLADRLVATNVLPASLRDECVAQALAREARGPTNVGVETALPHALLEEYDGVATALAVCPRGVDFGGGPPVKFVFLQVSSSASHDQYLGALACIARRMHDDAARRALASCATAAEIMAALKDDDSAGAPPAGADRSR